MIVRDKIYFSNKEGLNDPFDCPVMNFKDEVLNSLFENKGDNEYHPKILSLVRYEDDTENEFENINNPLMWSHYAKAHEGICIEYEFDNSFLDDRIIYTKVKYKDNLKAENVIDLFAIKSKFWSYEKEVRFISFGEKNLLPLKGRITKIIFGCECKDDDRELIKELIKGKDIELYEAKRDNNDYFKLDIEKLPIIEYHI